MTTYSQRQALIAAQIEAVERFTIPAPRRIGYADPPFEGYNISEMALKIPPALVANQALMQDTVLEAYYVEGLWITLGTDGAPVLALPGYFEAARPLALDALRRILAIDENTWSDLNAWRAAYRAAVAAVYGPYRLEWISYSRFIDARPQACWYATRMDLNRMYPLDIQEAA